MERFGARGLLQSARCLAQLLGRARITAGDRLGSDFHDVANVRLDRPIAFLAFEILAMALLGAHEGGRRWRSLREAMTASREIGEQ